MNLHKKAEVRQVLETILPWLGERRTAKAEEALERLGQGSGVKV